MNAPMEMLLATLAAVVALAISGYVQMAIPRFTAGAKKVLLTRAVLLAGGAVMGLLAFYAYRGSSALAAFFVGFGMVHVPAAVILFVKQERGAGKT